MHRRVSLRLYTLAFSTSPDFIVVIGEMRWNPQALRWEGNEHVLRDFDAVTGSSSRPALITHLTGSSMGSPVSGFAAGARVVGNMIFDPVKMCWLSRLPPEEDEPDVFADIGDEDLDDEWISKGGTIRASASQQPPQRETASSSMSNSSAVEHGDSSTSSYSSTDSSLATRQRVASESEGEQSSRRGSRPTLLTTQVDDLFVEQCQTAEQKHVEELGHWLLPLTDDPSPEERKWLYYIRELATKSY